ncbi:hypothetical protein [Terrimonas sp.]|uniref:hypothetical protein n=1 Tax=Terrimonas sp. TaxID=1914338 RepID=UPI0010572FFE|nr:hypothetical protein [Terrimonas sp.]
MLTVIVHLEAKNEKDTLSIIHDLGKGVAFFDHPKLAYLKQEMLFSGTEVKPRQREVVATEYFLEIETNPSLEKRIRQALSL